MAASSAARRRYPLHLHVTALFSLLVLATGASLAWLGYVESRALSLGAADRMAEELGRATRAGLQDAFAPVGKMVDVLAEQPLVSAATLDERLAALPVLALAFADAAPAAAAYVGYPDGAFFLLRPLRDDAARKRFEAPEGAAFLVDSVEMRGDERIATYVFLDAALREVGRRTRDNDGFDPRTRPWYLEAAAADRRIRTAPYVFFSTASPGVTLAARTRSGSVVGIDVTLHQVSELLRHLRPVPGAALAVMDADGRVFARVRRRGLRRAPRGRRPQPRAHCVARAPRPAEARAGRTRRRSSRHRSRRRRLEDGGAGDPVRARCAVARARHAARRACSPTRAPSASAACSPRSPCC